MGSRNWFLGSVKSLKIRALIKDLGEERGKEIQVSGVRCSGSRIKKKKYSISGKTIGKNLKFQVKKNKK